MVRSPVHDLLPVFLFFLSISQTLHDHDHDHEQLLLKKKSLKIFPLGKEKKKKNRQRFLSVGFWYISPQRVEVLKTDRLLHVGYHHHEVNRFHVTRTWCLRCDPWFFLIKRSSSDKKKKKKIEYKKQNATYRFVEAKT